MMILKERVLVKKGKKPAKVIGTPEGEETERVGKKYFPGSSNSSGVMARKET